VIIATDADQAGRHAACRDYWQLTPWGIDPHLAHLPGGTDPASVLTTFGPDTLQVILDNATPSANQMINN
jgi:DNA primase